MTVSGVHRPAATFITGRPERRRRKSWPAPTYPALRLDLTARHLIAATVRLASGNAEHRQADLECRWGEDGLAFLSVRSAFAALLESLQWPVGSEILVTGVNISDMARIISAAGHIAVAVDLDPATLAPDPAEIAHKISPFTRALLVAHLFGGQVDMAPLVRLARQHKLLVIEDRAQAFGTRESIDVRQSDVRLFSFGLLKTGTAFGGAIAEVGDAELRAGMRSIQLRWPNQSRFAHAGKVAKGFLFLLLQHPAIYTLFCSACNAAGSSSGEILRRLARGFGNGDTAALLRRLRRRPSAPLIAMLAWRFANDDGERVKRRAATGERMMAGLAGLRNSGLVCLGNRQALHSHWLVPVSVIDPAGLRSDLLNAGFDAHGASNVVAVGGDRARAMIDGLVFLPCYPEMSEDVQERVRGAVRAHLVSHHRAGTLVAGMNLQ